MHLKRAGKFAKNAKIEDITSSGGRLRCRSASNEQLGENLKLIDSGKTYSFIYPNSGKGKQEYKGIKARAIIVVPGEIIRRTRGAIKGNKVAIDGLDYLTSGLFVMPEESDEVSKPVDSSPSTRRVDSSSSSTGPPIWA